MTIRGAVASADIFDVFWLARLALGVNCAPNLLRGGQFGGHLGAEAEDTEALVEDECAIDGGEVRQHAALFEHRLLEFFEAGALVRGKVEPAY